MAFFSFTVGLFVGIASTGTYFKYKAPIDGLLSQAGFV